MVTGGGRRMLVVYCHPVEESFVGSIRRRAVDALQAGGHEVRVIDLYGEDFDPVLDGQDWRSHRAAARATQAAPAAPAIERHVGLVRWADGIVFVYPTWFGAQPAMLKGWIDRVWGRRLALDDVRTIHVLTTHGSGKLMNAVQGEPGKRVVLRGLAARCGRRCRVRWIAFYGNDRATPSDRTAFLERVDRSMNDV